MTLLRRLVPAPLVSVALLVLWLALSRTASVGDLLVGLILAFVIPALTSKLRVRSVRVRRPLVVARYVVSVARDVLVSNMQVALGVVFARSRRPQARFVVVPLELRDPVGLAVLAMVTTIVPGTVWSEIALDRSKVMLHVWDVDEEDAFVAHYKARYEQPLREIFE